MAFKNLYRAVAHSDVLVFYDVEATQFSKQLISFGMVIVKKKRDSFDMEKIDEFFSLIKPDKKYEIGNYVEKLTSLKKEDVDKGISNLELKKILQDKLQGFNRICFISYGELDKGVLLSSINDKSCFLYDKDTHFFDFHSYLKKNLVDEKGSSYSLLKLVKLFKLDENIYSFHNPLDDSKALYDVFSYFVNNEDKIKKLIDKSYFNNQYLMKYIKNDLDIEMRYKNL